MPYRVLIVDDQVFHRQYFESLISDSEQYSLTASIASASVADAYCAAGNVDIVIMDVIMSDGSNGLDAAEAIKRSFPHIKLLVVTSMPDSLILRRARDIGVDSFWYKDVQDAPMLEVMDRTMAGEHVYPDSPPPVKLGLSGNYEFTSREMEVLRKLAAGYSNPEIAEELDISVNTVRFHISSILSKTGFTSRTELAIKTARSGLVALDL